MNKTKSSINAPQADPFLKELRQRYENNPQDVGAVIDLVRRYSALGRSADALEVCRAAMKNHSRAYSFLLEFANVLFRHGDVRESRMIFKKLTELKPERVEAWNNLGILELSAGNLEEAHRAFSKVLNLEPRNAGALCNTGNYFAEKGDAALAATYFERALEARGDFVEAWYNLGNSYISLGQFSSAKEAFLRAIFYDDKFASAHKNLGFTCERLGEYDDALEYYGRSAALNRNDAGIQANMANVHIHMEQYGKALECAKRAVRLAPKEPSNWGVLREAAMRQKDGKAYYRAVTALINAISDGCLAQSIKDLREMGFKQEAEDLLEYTVKLNRSGINVDALPFTESKMPKLPADEINRLLYKSINQSSKITTNI